MVGRAGLGARGREEKRRERGREERGHKILAELTRLADFLKRSYNYTGYEIHAVFSIYSMKNVRDNIGHEAHLGGAIAGFFLTIFIKPEILANSFFTVLILMIPIIYFYLKNR